MAFLHLEAKQLASDQETTKDFFCQVHLAAFIENQVHFGSLGWLRNLAWLRITDAGGADPTWTWQAEDSTEVPCHRAGARQVEKFDQSPVLEIACEHLLLISEVI